MENLRQKPDSNFLAIHSTAKQVDERYIATKEDEEKVKQDFFLSLDPLKLKSIPRKEKYKIIVLRILCETLTQKNYTEKQLNDILQPVYEDFASLRRCLIEYGFFLPGFFRANLHKTHLKKGSDLVFTSFCVLITVPGRSNPARSDL